MKGITSEENLEKFNFSPVSKSLSWLITVCPRGYSLAPECLFQDMLKIPREGSFAFATCPVGSTLS
jgi:hypothetical protein